MGHRDDACPALRDMSSDDNGHLLEEWTSDIVFQDPLLQTGDNLRRGCARTVGADDHRITMHIAQHTAPLRLSPRHTASHRSGPHRASRYMEQLSSGYPAGGPPDWQKCAKYAGKTFISAFHVRPREIVNYVVRFFDHLGFQEVEKRLSASVWEVVFKAFEYRDSRSCKLRLKFFSYGVAGSAVEFHRDADCSILSANVLLQLREWLKQDGDTSTLFVSDVYCTDVPEIAVDEDYEYWDWLDEDEFDPELTLLLAKQQNGLGLQSLCDKLLPKMQRIVQATCPEDILCVTELFDFILAWHRHADPVSH